MIISKLLNNGFLREEATDPASGGTPPAGGANNPPQEQENTPPPNNIMDGYSFGDPPAEEESQETPDDSPFELTLGENITPEMKTFLTEKAKESGFEAEKASSFISAITAKMEEDSIAAVEAEDKSLRDDWGRDYEKNMKQAQAFAHKLSKASGLSMEELEPFASPRGFRLLNAIASMTGESSVSGATMKADSQIDPKKEAEELVKGIHPKYGHAILDPSHALHREANEYYNRIVGIATTSKP